MDFDHLLDAKGLNCPLPILRCKKSLANIESGQVLKVEATDPGSIKDFHAFCKQTGHEMLASEAHEELSPKVFVFYIKKRAL